MGVDSVSLYMSSYFRKAPGDHPSQVSPINSYSNSISEQEYHLCLLLACFMD
jgi:hypothetical protein